MQKQMWAVMLAVMLALVVGGLRPAVVKAAPAVATMDDCDSALFSMIATAAAFSDAISDYNSLNSTFQANLALWNDPSFPLYHDPELGTELQIAAINVEDAGDYMMGAGLAAESAATNYAHCY